MAGTNAQLGQVVVNEAGCCNEPPSGQVSFPLDLQVKMKAALVGALMYAISVRKQYYDRRR